MNKMVEYRDGLNSRRPGGYLTPRIVDNTSLVEERSYRELLGDPINRGLNEASFVQLTDEDFIEAGIGVQE